jgi:saccharopine dehydrogenase-like NADP-dependent oxidoreductase
MERHFNNIALIGYGRIGQAIKTYLTNAGYIVDAYDIKPSKDVITLDPNAMAVEDFKKILKRYDGVITATPYHLNTTIAEAAIDTGTAYFDLTEDISAAKAIRLMAANVRYDDRLTWVMPQCGLAPGAVNMIARKMADQFDEVHDVNVRVGALPITTNNKMKYYLTWSSEGLVNEYCNPCDALIGGKRVLLQPLEGYEELVLDGLEYEAFNTSGGIGTLIDTLTQDGRSIQNINYKTLRYKGHRDLMRFLLDDLGLAKRQSVLVDIFNREIPHVSTDVVVIFIQVIGIRDGQLQADTYHRKIYGDNQFTAIQRTTALGLCAAVNYWATRPWNRNAATEWNVNGTYVMAPQYIDDLVDCPFWSVYR